MFGGGELKQVRGPEKDASIGRSEVTRDLTQFTVWETYRQLDWLGVGPEIGHNDLDLETGQSFQSHLGIFTFFYCP